MIMKKSRIFSKYKWIGNAEKINLIFYFFICLSEKEDMAEFTW